MNYKGLLKCLALFCSLLPGLASAQQQPQRITGTVTDANNAPLPNVNIQIKHSDQGTKSDESGHYNLPVNPGDTLVFSYLGMQTFTVSVSAIQSPYHVRLEPADLDLDIVEIKVKRALKSQNQLLKEYATNKNLIKTSWGILDKDGFSGTLTIIDGNQLINAGPDFLTSLQALVPNMRVVREAEGIFVFLQRFVNNFSSEDGVQISNPPALFDTDGTISENPPTYLVGSDIERVAILDRNSGIAKYGPRGAGGVIILNTKGQASLDELDVDRSFDKKMLLDSLIASAARPENYLPFQSAYLQALIPVRNRKKAWAIHEQQKKNHANHPYYYLDVCDYFLTRWNNTAETDLLKEEIVQRFSDRPEVIKALAYIQEKHGNYDLAVPLFESILANNTMPAQAYRDLANAYAEAADFKNAMTFYTHFGNASEALTGQAYDSSGEDNLITTELLNLLHLHGSELPEEAQLEGNTLEEGTRLVLEWNEPAVEFALDFINPYGSYDTWENAPRKDTDVPARYSSVQLFLDNDLQGKWVVNLNELHAGNDHPTYLKITIFYNYGQSKQSMEIKVFRLENTDRSLELFEFMQR